MRDDLTGCWYNPNIKGSGFLIDDAPEHRSVYWFGYSTGFPKLPDGQLWFLADPIDGNRNHLRLYRPEGEWMGSDYEIGDPIGYLSLEQVDDNNLKVSYRFDGIGYCQPVNFSPSWPGCSGEFEVTRLTRRA